MRKAISARRRTHPEITRIIQRHAAIERQTQMILRRQRAAERRLNEQARNYRWLRDRGHLITFGETRGRIDRAVTKARRLYPVKRRAS